MIPNSRRPPIASMGRRAIVAFLGLTERQCRYRLERQLIPHAREGERFVASKRALLDYWARMTSGTGAAA